MLESIRWSQYWGWMALVLLTYYLFIVLFFYRVELLLFLRRSSGGAVTPGLAGPFPGLEGLDAELNSFLEQIRVQHSPREELLYGLQQLLKKYSDLVNNDPVPAREWVRLTLLQQGFDLSENDLRFVWMG